MRYFLLLVYLLTASFVYANTPKGITFPLETAPTGGSIYASSTQLCSEDSVRIFFNGESNVSSYLWFKDGFPINGSANKTPLEVKEPGIYYVRMQLNTGGFENTNSVTINLVPPSVNIVVSSNGVTNFCAGGSVVLTSNINNSIQWQRNKQNINNAFQANFTATEAGNYRVRYAGGTCPTFSNEITVTLLNTSIPQITQINTIANPCIGDTIRLSANNVAVQWQRNGADLFGETSNTLNVTGNGIYRARTNDACNSVSNEININNFQAKAIVPVVQSGGNTDICNGGTVTLVSSLPGVQWFRNGLALPGANAQFYQALISGTYTARINGTGCGLPAISNAVEVSIGNIVNPPQAPIISQLSYGGKYHCYGSSTQLQSSVAGVQWQKNGIDLPGETAQVLTINDNGIYRAILRNVQNSGCNLSSNEMSITYFTIPPAPQIGFQGNPVLCVGNTVTLVADIERVDWFKDGQRIGSGKTINITQSGTYTASYATNGPCASPPSNQLLVQFQNGPNAPVISLNGTNTLCTGSSAALIANTSNVQWQRNGETIPGVTGNILNTAQAGIYRAFVTNNNGCNSFSNDITLNVSANNLSAPVISLLGNSGTVICPDNYISLQSTQNNIQWQKDGVDIPDAKYSVHTTNEPGTYRAYIPGSIACGSNYSNAIVLTAGNVTATPQITASGVTQFCKGQSVNLTSNLDGVRWQKSGIDIPNSNVKTITITESGYYSAYIPNAQGCKGANSNFIDVMVADTIKNALIAAPASFNNICRSDSVLLTLNNVAFSAYSGLQWQKDGVSIAGANTTSFFAKETGFYRVLISSYCSSAPVITNAIGVTVSSLPTVIPTIAASSQNLCNGNVLLVSNVNNVKWQRNGIDIPNATGTTFNANAEGIYTAIATTTNTCNLPSKPVSITNSGSQTGSISIAAAGSTAICEGSYVMLNGTSANVTGVQWQRNGINIVGANQLSYKATLPGTYRLYDAFNACANSFSNEITITVTNSGITVPVITALNNANFLCNGTTTILNANNNNVLWYKNGLVIPNSGGSQITINSGGNYQAITNDANGCNLRSNIISIQEVNANSTPIISLKQGTQSFCNGQFALLESNIANVKWQLDGVDIPLNSNATLLVSKGGTYRAYVPGSLQCGGNYSNNLTINVYPSVTPTVSLTGNNTTCFGGNVALSTNLPGIQWLRNNQPIAGATAQNFTATTTGNYSVSFTERGCTITSNTVPVFILGAPPVLSTNGDAVICGTNGVVIKSDISSGTVQWQKNQIDIPGATNYSYTATSDGDYRMYITNAGSVCPAGFSNTITVTTGKVPGAPTIVASGPVNLCEGSTVTLTSTINDVVWQKDFVTLPISGSVTQTYTTSEAGTYRAVVFGDGCAGYSNPITVTVTPRATAPVIEAQGSTKICESNSVTLISNTSGVIWQRNGVNTNINTTSFNATQSGIYRAIVPNINGCNGISNEIEVSVEQPVLKPVITATTPTTICAGGSVNLVSNVPGIIWQRDFVTVEGDSTNTNYLATRPGTYRAAIFGAGCPGYSNPITVRQTTPLYNPIAYRITPMNACDTGDVVIASTVTPAANATIIWQRDSVDIPGSNSVRYTAKTSGNYRISIFQSGQCTSYSNFLAIKTNATPNPSIKWNGTLLSTDAGFNFYQWLRNNTVISGANNLSYRPIETGKYRVIGSTGAGCNFASDEFNLVVTSINPTPIEIKSVQIFPNPANNQTIIDIGYMPIEPIQIVISNVSGQKISSFQLTKKWQSIPCSNWSNGIYFIEIISSKEKKVLKLLVQH